LSEKFQNKRWGLRKVDGDCGEWDPLDYNWTQSDIDRGVDFYGTVSRDFNREGQQGTCSKHMSFGSAQLAQLHCHNTRRIDNWTNDKCVGVIVEEMGNLYTPMQRFHMLTKAACSDNKKVKPKTLIEECDKLPQDECDSWGPLPTCQNCRYRFQAFNQTKTEEWVYFDAEMGGPGDDDGAGEGPGAGDGPGAGIGIGMPPPMSAADHFTKYKGKDTENTASISNTADSKVSDADAAQHCLNWSRSNGPCRGWVRGADGRKWFKGQQQIDPTKTIDPQIKTDKTVDTYILKAEYCE